MFLAKFRLDIRYPSVRQCLRDCHDMHRSLMSAFPDGVSRAENHMLYRLMTLGSETYLYLSSAAEPDAEPLAKKGFSPSGIRCVDALRDIFIPGSRWRYDILAVPSKKVKAEGRKNSRRAALSMPEERSAWLDGKGAQNGFRPLSLREMGETRAFGIRGKMPFSFTAVRFNGVLEVTDQDLFWSGYCRGIGPERSYGMGMLLISRP
ncbi:type I-E CRISPR-associated protein Cas6/Cse3/CasE [Synergistes jonesii]|uniref:type I-E CRISPR-associated protein Cas6/Cse3/CasE n=1 Tax=Synergistes jonesii TaxID=2754 RepID=UPI00332EA382